MRRSLKVEMYNNLSMTEKRQRNQRDNDADALAL